MSAGRDEPSRLRLWFAGGVTLEADAARWTLHDATYDEHGHMVAPIRLDYDPLDDASERVEWINVLALVAVTSERVTTGD